MNETWHVFPINTGLCWPICIPWSHEL